VNLRVDSSSLRRASSKLRTKMSPKKIVIKLGGSVLKSEEMLRSLCRDLIQLQSTGVYPIVVHGGGPAINEELTRRGMTWEFHNGLRVTPDPMMDVIEMVLCGKINRRLVRTLNGCGGKGIGFSGADGNLLQCVPEDSHLGSVGRIERVNTGLLDLLLNPDSAMIPVIAPIGIDSDGNAYNINADWVASKIAQALKVQRLIYITDQDGVLDSNGNVIQVLSDQDLERLIQDEVVQGGMLAKAQTILDAIHPSVGLIGTRGSRSHQFSKVRRVHVLNANYPQAILAATQNRSRVGTVCQLGVLVKGN